jgi:hypothetical protein
MRCPEIVYKKKLFQAGGTNSAGHAWLRPKYQMAGGKSTRAATRSGPEYKCAGRKPGDLILTQK